MKHIGIVGCSAPGAALCHQTICTEGAALLGKKYAHPEVSMHTYPFHEYMRRVEAGDWPAVAELMLSSAQKLARIGADFLITPDNTIHQALELLLPRSRCPCSTRPACWRERPSRRLPAETSPRAPYSEEEAAVLIAVDQPQECLE